MDDAERIDELLQEADGDCTCGIEVCPAHQRATEAAERLRLRQGAWLATERVEDWREILSARELTALARAARRARVAAASPSLAAVPSRRDPKAVPAAACECIPEIADTMK